MKIEINESALTGICQDLKIDPIPVVLKEWHTPSDAVRDANDRGGRYFRCLGIDLEPAYKKLLDKR